MTKKKKSRRSRSSPSRASTGSRQRSVPVRPKATEGNGKVASDSVAASDASTLAHQDEDLEGDPSPRPAAGAKKRAEAPRASAPRGLFGGLRAPSPFPRFGESMRAAGLAVATSPPLVVAPLVAVLVLWLVLVAVGLDHVPAGFLDIMAIPPVSSFFDINLVFGTFRNLGGGGVALLFGLIFLRGLIWAALVALILEALRGDRPSSVTLFAVARALPASIAYLVVNVAAFFVVQYVSVILGNLGGLLSLLGFVGALHFLVFTPIAALNDSVSFREAIRRSVAVARFPGSRHVGLVFLYFFVAFMPLQYTLQAPGPFSANPTVSQWAIVLALTLLHVVFLAAFAFRYVAVADRVPEPKTRAAPARRR